MRMLGVDFGSKRIGIAVGDSDHGITTALPNLAASGTLSKDAKLISTIGKSEHAEAIVVGIPVNPKNGNQRMPRICLQLVDRIKEEGWNVFTVDEAFTSKESESNLSRLAGREQVKRHVDGEAARLILEQFFHGQR